MIQEEAANKVGALPILHWKLANVFFSSESMSLKIQRGKLPVYGYIQLMTVLI